MATSAGEQLIDLVRQGWSKKSTLENWSMIVGMLCYAFSRFYEFRRARATSDAPLAHLGLAPNNLVRSMVSEYRDAASRRA